MPIHFYIKIDIHNQSVYNAFVQNYLSIFVYTRTTQYEQESIVRPRFVSLRAPSTKWKVLTLYRSKSFFTLLFAIYVYDRKLIYFLITGLAGIRDLFELDCGFNPVSGVYIYIYWYCGLNFIVSNIHRIFCERISIYEMLKMVFLNRFLTLYFCDKL